MSAWVHKGLPRVLSSQWRRIEVREDGASYMYQRPGVGHPLSVIVSGAVELDGKRWLHVSCAYASRLPSWEDLRMVKDLFIGPDRAAYQVLPPTAKHVNIHSYCLHLWSCVDGDPLPDFTQGGDSI